MGRPRPNIRRGNNNPHSTSAIGAHYTRLVGAPLAWNEGPKDEEETHHPNQPGTKIKNDSEETDREGLTTDVGSKCPN